jgi:glyoxylase-like metal-dependent hydrolase (beta-lactamase superfamily II)
MTDEASSKVMRMKQIAPGIQQWSFFSDEKQLDFNGLLLTMNDHRILVDPPPLDTEARMAVLKGPPLDYIVLTNRDHVRETEACRREFQAKIYVPAADAVQMDIAPDKTYQDGELLPGGLWVIHLEGMKSPGESALFLERGKGILILGDALIGKPPNHLSLLAAEKLPDIGKAKEGLRRLLKYNFDMVLVGDGASILTEGKEAVRRAIDG